MPGTSGDEDDNTGTLPTLACPGHRGHSVIFKPPPPTVHPMQHAGSPAGTEQQCARGAEQKRQRLAEVELRETLERAFEAYGEPLENVM